MSKPIPASPKLGVLFQGMGAVTSTMIAGALAVSRGLGEPVGSLSQLANLRPPAPGPGAPEAAPQLIKECVDLTPISGLVFGGWDIFGGDMVEACEAAKVLEGPLLEQLREPLSQIRPMPGAFDPAYVKRLNGTHIKGGTRREWAEAIRADIRRFKEENQLERCVVVNCASTEAFAAPSSVLDNLSSFEQALDANDPRISPSMIYAYAALQERLPYANGTPSPGAEVPALQELAMELGVPTTGKDFKTGQTMVKTVIAPMLKARMLGVKGWFSTNILGNRDGEVLDEPDNFLAKEQSKLGVLGSILEPEAHPALYGDIYHKVRINYYPPRGDDKEGWDNIDLFGWLGYPMQLKVDFLCRDSILAAPIVLDLALFLDLADRAGRRGIQDWLSFYWKSPDSCDESVTHDLFDQRRHLDDALWSMRRQ